MMPDWLSAQAMARPDGAALIVGEAMLTYRALNEQTAQFAARLFACGVSRGDVVGILLPNRLETALAIHAAVQHPSHTGGTRYAGAKCGVPLPDMRP
jgi:acyl-CoA synthetase (AMP-forming)/AMP-acid ligase II